jgi:integrase
LEKWRNALVGAKEDREQQRRAQSTAERVRRTFFAALNYARRTNPDKVPSDQAWRSVYSFRNIDRPRTRFLSVSEAKRLLNAMPQDFRQLARGALYTGLRLGELLALTVSDFGDGQIHVRHSKGGKERTVPLSPEASSFSTKLQRERQAILCFFSRIRVGSGSTRAGTWLAPARQRRSPRPQYFMSCAAVTAACYSIEAPARR